MEDFLVVFLRVDIEIFNYLNSSTIIPNHYHFLVVLDVWFGNEVIIVGLSPLMCKTATQVLVLILVLSDCAFVNYIIAMLCIHFTNICVGSVMREGFIFLVRLTWIL